MNKFLIFANWKATPKSSKVSLDNFRATNKINSRKLDVVVFPPSVFLSELSKNKCIVGAQDVSIFSEGAHTGEVTSEMLKSVGARYCIVGHSERRTQGENREVIYAKITRLLKSNIHPVLCIGEKERDAEGLFFEYIKEEIGELFKGRNKNDVKKIIIAYEPVWAISTEKKGNLDKESISEMILFIRKNIFDLFGKDVSNKIKIIYGGSVNYKNILDISNSSADGVLVGSASQNPKTFISLLSLIK